MDPSTINKIPENNNIVTTNNEMMKNSVKHNLDYLETKINYKNNGGYSYKIDKNNVETKYIPTFKGVEFPGVKTTDELIKTLKIIQKLLPKLLEVFKNNGGNDKFYSGIDYLDQVFDASTYEYTPNKKGKDLYIDNRMGSKDFNTLDTKALSYEGLKKLIPGKDDYFYNKFTDSLVKAINIYTSF